MTDLVKLVYALLIGLSVAFVAGMSISAFNPGPSFPGPSSYTLQPSEEQMQEEQTKFKDYEEEYAQHSSETSKIALAASVAIFLAGLAAAKRKKLNEVTADGLLLGGLFTAIYAASRSVAHMYPSQNAELERWVSVAAALTALVMAIVIAQLKFSPVSPRKSKAKK